MFLSLKWQSTIAVSLVLLVSFGLLTLNRKFSLESEFNNVRDRVLRDREYAVAAATDTVKLQLNRLADHMQGQAMNQEVNSSQSALISTIDTHWDQLNFDWGVDSIALINQSENVVSQWGSAIDLGKIPAIWMSQAFNSEAPVSHLWCTETCSQLVIVPAFLDPPETGLLILSSSVTDAMLFFQKNSGADIAILSKPFSKRGSYWDMTAAAMTNAEQSSRILTQLAADRPQAQATEQRNIVADQSAHFEVSFIPLTEKIQSNRVYLAIIDDVTNDLTDLNSALYALVLSAVLALIITEFLLLSTLWLPMSRLQKLATLLPMLAKNDRDQVNRSLNNYTRGAKLTNEIHNLFYASYALSNTLAALDQDVKDRETGLKKRSEELLQEKNFINNLINNTHVILITQSMDNEIKLINAEGRKVLSYDHPLTDGTRFLDYFNARDKIAFEKGMQGIYNQEHKEFEQEVTIVDEHGEKVHLHWYHNLLPRDTSEEPLLLSVGMDLTARRAAEENLAWLSDHDPLTNLYNRKRFQTEFNHLLVESSRTEQKCALFTLDIDQFKYINDTSGHPVGDQILRDTAAKLGKLCGAKDIIARLGGDEFSLIIEFDNQSEIAKTANSICEAIQALEFNSQGARLKISISMGVAIFPEHGRNVDELMACADLGLNRSKNESIARNTWQLYSSDSRHLDKLHSRVAWKRKIELALSEDRFTLYFQPIYNIERRLVSHYECLVRMVDENNAIISPGEFIPIAEQTGLIEEIDLQVVRLALAALVKFDQNAINISLSINLSAKAVSNSAFVDIVEREFLGDDSLRSKIIFELTETSAVEDLESASRLIENFKTLGYKFALDDFGVGFSSWYYLRQLPVDYVKIDGSFVKNLSTNKEDRLFIDAINKVAQGLGKKTIAEFVENKDILSHLASIGVDYAQGYYIGKPEPLEQILESFPKPKTMSF